MPERGVATSAPRAVEDHHICRDATRGDMATRRINHPRTGKPIDAQVVDVADIRETPHSG